MDSRNDDGLPESILVVYACTEEGRAEEVRRELESADDRFEVTPRTQLDGLLNGESLLADCLVVADDLTAQDPIEVCDHVDSIPVILHTRDWQERFQEATGAIDAIVREGEGELTVLDQRIRTHVDRDRTEETVQHLAQEYNLVSDVASDIFWTYDVTSDEFTVDSGIDQFGFDHEEVGDSLGWWLQHIDEDDRGRVQALYGAIFDGDKSVFDSADDQGGEVTTEFTLETGDGSEIVCLVRTLCLFDDAGNPVQLIGAGTDVTDQREAQARYESLVEFSSSVIAVVDEDGTFEYNSPSVERVVGYSLEELRGESVFEYVHPEDRERVQSAFFDMVSGEEQTVTTVEVRLKHADGWYIWVEAIGSNRDSPALDGYVVNYRDITDRKRYETELERVKRRYDAIFDDREAYFVLTDTDMTVLDANEASLSLVEQPRERIFGESFVDTPWLQLSDVDPATFSDYHERAVRGETVRFEVELDRSDDTLFLDVILRPVTQGGSVEAVVTVGRNITRIKRRERALDTLLEATRDLEAAREQEAVIESAVHALAEFVDEKLAIGWLYNEETETLEPVAATAEASELVDQMPTLTGGESLAWEAFESGTYRKFDDVSTEPGRYSEEPMARSELILPLSDTGVLVVGSTQEGAFEEMDFALAQLLATSTEASLDRAQREQMLRQQSEQLRQQNEQLEQVASILSHDLRNPLNVATLRTELAMRETNDENLEDVEMALDRMSQLIEDVLRLARGGQAVTDTETIDMEEIISECWTVVSTGEGSLTLEESFAIRADDSRFRHVLENLFGNAIDHGGSDVTVRVGRLDDGFYVADDGPGIPEEEHENIFEAGYTNSDDGTGFGLTIVDSITTAHGWEITVTEGESGGARFEFRNVEIAE